MIQILLRAALIAIGAAAASLVIVLTFAPAGGGMVEGTGITMSIVCPLVLAFPCTAYFLIQKRRLDIALVDLTVAHERLAETHAELAEAYARLSEKARHDDMTGLLNRETFFAALKNARRRTDSGTLLIIDADNFKYINDTHGHQQGDAALALIADAISKGVREHDLVGRIGGEEFGAFLPGATEEEAMIVAERVRLAVEALRFHPGEGKYMPLSVSIGAAKLRPNLSWSETIREADSRLYEAKRRGRNRVVFENSARAAA